MVAGAKLGNRIFFLGGTTGYFVHSVAFVFLLWRLLDTLWRMYMMNSQGKWRCHGGRFAQALTASWQIGYLEGCI